MCWRERPRSLGERKLPGCNPPVDADEGRSGDQVTMTNSVRTILIIVMLFAGVAVAEAQQAGKIYRIGFLDTSTASGMAVLVKAFRQELNKLGWIEGKNITIDYRFAENRGNERLSELAVDLVGLKVDLIVIT